ncbi:Dynamin family-domain-containing protein [Hypoxylon sp. FL1857]|nr:Dynamin family-domain-containing protein [Hypoxylon sp. FL1857]
MNLDRPIEADTSASDAPFVKSEPLDNPTRLPSIPRAGSPQSSLDPSPAQSHAASAAPLSPARQVGTEATAFLDATIKAEPETESDQQPESHETVAEDTNYLEILVSKTVPEVLESGVAIGVDLLDQLKATLSAFVTPDVEAWLKSIDDLKARSKPTRTVVGVVGNTGAGKSSVINALLDEERLLPTNCLRACTASPTEISYNYSDDVSELYRAEIEFITAEEWTKELEILFSDLLDGSGRVSRDCSNPDSEAGVAYEKLKAVYPLKTKEMIAQGTPKDFATEPSVRGVLGSVKILKDGSAKDLYSRLQHYVDSREKVTSDDHKKRGSLMEYWPLIKVVRIYTKANALSTGAVIVDLPGVQDSNAARAAVAEKYMKSCTGLWIVAPITRAVDDKTAKSLLGDSFKRQLKYDGTYSAVSFICSKTDDISITEAVDSLGLEEELSESWNRHEELENSKEALQSRLIELKKQRSTLDEEYDWTDHTYDLWEELYEEIIAGVTVYAPAGHLKKRKRRQTLFRSRKDRKSCDAEVDDDHDASDHDSSDKENSQSARDGKPVTEDDVDEKMASLKVERKMIREERREVDAEIASTRNQIQEMEAEREGILVEMKARCVQGRNDYSRGAIKQDFAMGIKELDQENAAEENDATFDPDQDLRDYDEVARTLPVFCVSSRAYQKLRGRLQKDNFQSEGFISPEDTEIPQLQQHAKKLTEAGRASNCRRFLNDLAQLTNSMKLWASSDGMQCTLSDVERGREELHLRNLLNDLEKGFDASVKEAVQLLKQSLSDNVYRVFDASIPEAVNAALDTANGWGAPRAQGGMFWATYKATVRRKGVYHGAAGPHDFNQELFDPISRNLATGWERAFQHRLPAVLNGFVSKTKKQLSAFHEAAQARAQGRHTTVSGMATLSRQILAHMRALEQLPEILRATITDLQKEANRRFTPAICNAMTWAYQTCTEESGVGSFNRMKSAMASHVETARHTMFQGATDTVKAELEAMCRAVQKRLTDEVEDMFSVLFKDYMKVLVGVTVDRPLKLTPQELSMRANVNNIIARSDSMFGPALGEPAIEEPQRSEGMSPATSTGPVPGESTSINLEASADAEAPMDMPGAMEMDSSMQDVRGNASLIDAEELIMEQLRAETLDYDSEQGF